MYIYLKFKIILLKITHPPRNKVNLEIFFSIITNIIISIIGLWNTLLCIESFVSKRIVASSRFLHKNLQKWRNCLPRWNYAKMEFHPPGSPGNFYDITIEIELKIFLHRRWSVNGYWILENHYIIGRCNYWLIRWLIFYSILKTKTLSIGYLI